MSRSTSDDLPALRRDLAWRHHFAGWSALLLFLTLGAGLEALHGFKVGYYLDPDHRVRREMWRLAHAHGTLLALVQLAFASSLERFGGWSPGRLRLTSFFLLDAVVLIPLGFFLGGIWPSEADPWIGVMLVPVGALLLFVAVVLVLLAAGEKARLPRVSAPGQGPPTGPEENPPRAGE